MRRLYYCLYLVFSVGIILLIVEGALRIIGYMPNGLNTPRFYQNLPGDLEPNLHIRDHSIKGLPFALTANNQGTRGTTSFNIHKPKRTIRILCIGDSFTFGHGVDDQYTYSAQLLQELKGRYPGVSFEVINSGIPMFGILDEMDYYLQKGAALQPDIVVLQFFTNDIQDMTGAWGFRESHAHDASYSHRPLLSELLSWSRLYQAAEYIQVPYLKNLAAPRANDRAGSGTYQINEGLNPYRFESTPEEREFAGNAEHILGPDSGRKLSRVWQAYKNALQGMRDKIQAAGGKMIFLLIPDVIEMRNGGYYADHQELAPALNSLGIPTVDMLHPFRVSRYVHNIKPYLTPIDGHCSPHGYSLIAQGIANLLEVKQDSAGTPAITVKPAPPVDSLLSPTVVDLSITPEAPIAFSSQPSLTGKVVSATGFKMTPNDEVHIDALSAADEANGQAVVTLEFHSDRPLSIVELRLPCAVKKKSGSESSVTVEFSSDGKTWDTLLHQTDENPEGGSGFEHFVMLDKRIAHRDAKDFLFRISLKGASFLYTERTSQPKRSRIMTVTTFPTMADAAGDSRGQ